MVQQPAGEAMEKKKECNIRWPKKCTDLNIRETKKSNSLLETSEPTCKKNNCHNNSLELTFHQLKNSTKKKPKTSLVEVHHMY
jgi:hypothetical protein